MNPFHSLLPFIRLLRYHFPVFYVKPLKQSFVLDKEIFFFQLPSKCTITTFFQLVKNMDYNAKNLSLVYFCKSQNEETGKNHQAALSNICQYKYIDQPIARDTNASFY